MSDDLEHGIRYSPNQPDPTGPHIIRTTEELEALDGMTVLMNADEGHPLTLVWHWFDSDGNLWPDSKYDLPAVVVATGEQVRAARKALEEA